MSQSGSAVLCVRQLDRHAQSKDSGPGTEGYQGRKSQVPSSGQTENKDFASRVTFPPPAYCWSFRLDPFREGAKSGPGE